MADGYAQASGTCSHVNLHTAPGTGNGMGNLVTAWHNKTPLIVTAGQQTREMLLLEPRLTSRRPTELPQPYVKWAYEPARAQDIPAAVLRAYATAMQPPAGPVFLSCRWTTGPSRPTHRPRRERSPPGSRRTRNGWTSSPGCWPPATTPCSCTGLGWTAPAVGRQLSPWPSGWPPRSGPPRPRAGRVPRGPPALSRSAAVRDRPLAEALRGHDTVLVVGAPVFRYYPYVPGEHLPDGARLLHVTDDPDEAARAPVGDSLLSDPGWPWPRWSSGCRRPTGCRPHGGTCRHRRRSPPH
ncbi:thiamine pyrophosphate-binding protein [Micromonospora sp. M12]